MARELKFNLVIDSTALFCPNPVEFYSKCYINDDIVNSFRTIPGVKYATEIATTSFNNILKPSACDFVAGNQTLSAVTVNVKAISALAELCRFDLETSFLSEKMVRGSNNSFEVAEFMTYYWSELSKQINHELSIMAWQGVFASTGTTYLELVDGFQKLLLADATVKDVAATTITAANVIAEMDKVYNTYLTGVTACSINDSDLTWYVASDVYGNYLRATAAGNTQAYITAQLPATYLGIRLLEAKGLSLGKMVLTNKNNLIYAFDGLNDEAQIKTIDLSDTVAEPKLRTRVNLKAGFQIVNGSQIVYYN